AGGVSLFDGVRADELDLSECACANWAGVLLRVSAAGTETMGAVDRARSDPHRILVVLLAVYTAGELRLCCRQCECRSRRSLLGAICTVVEEWKCGSCI